MDNRHEDVSMMLAIVRLLSTLNVVTVAEGIETAEQLDYLGAMGCDRGQGYLFARPLPANETEALFAAHDAPLIVRHEQVA
jgi:EAL domain-containing protein (putative c-di-GMP-specific phosphodiesterase class I)